LNDLNFTKIVDDKFVTSLVFPEWSKKNYLVRSKEEILNISSKIKSSKIVIKPLSDSGGNGVFILNKRELLKFKPKGENIMQDFIDSSKGVPGIKSGTHDLRLVFVNEKIIYTYIREPKKGSYLANLAQGGKLTIVPIKNLPKTLTPIIDRVKVVFDSFPHKIFALDFMFDEKGRPWIVELNSMPGLFFTPSEKPYMMEVYAELLNLFKKILK
jgi:glutathione synthase